MAQQRMAEERRRIQAQNAAIIQQSMNYNRPQCPPAGANYPQAYYPQAGFPRTGFASQSNPRKEAERRYLEARADFYEHQIPARRLASALVSRQRAR